MSNDDASATVVVAVLLPPESVLRYTYRITESSVCVCAQIFSVSSIFFAARSQKYGALFHNS